MLVEPSLYDKCEDIPCNHMLACTCKKWIIYNHFQVTPAPVTDIQFLKPKHSNKRWQPSTQDPLHLIKHPQKKQISGDTGPHQHPQISKEGLYRSLHNLVPNACLAVHHCIWTTPADTFFIWQQEVGPYTYYFHNSAESQKPTVFILCLPSPAHSTSQQIDPPFPSDSHCPPRSIIQEAGSSSGSICNTLPLPLTELFSEEFQALRGQLLLEKAEEVFRCMTLSKHESELLEKATQN